MSDSNNAPRVDILRSPLGRARGLGAAHRGAAAWWTFSLSSIALVPLTLWFVWSMVQLTGATREDIGVWLSRPLPLVLMLCMVAITFYHMKAGLETVVEDYVHQSPWKMVALMAIKAVTGVLGLLCIVSVLRIGL